MNNTPNSSNYNSECNDSDENIHNTLKNNFLNETNQIQMQSFINCFTPNFENLRVRMFNDKSNSGYLTMKITDSFFEKIYFVMRGTELKKLTLDGKIIYYVLTLDEINEILKNIEDEKFYFVESL